MLISVLGSLGGRLDAKFITAYFFPAFVAVLGTIVVVVKVAEHEPFVAWLAQLDSIGQMVVVLVLVLTTAMVAYLLRAMARPIAQLFAGRAFPALVQQPSIRRQLRARARTRFGLGMLQRGERLFPRDPADTEPTAFGNVLTGGADYPRLVYGMETYHWWPRLLPLLPPEFRDLLSSLETPMRTMLNLSLVSLYLGCLSAVALGLAPGRLPLAVVCLVIGVLLAHFFYRAAVAQAIELVRNIWVGFDLYRSEILTQLHEEQPASLEAERALWQRLMQRLQDLDEPGAAARGTQD